MIEVIIISTSVQSLKDSRKVRVKVMAMERWTARQTLVIEQVTHLYACQKKYVLQFIEIHLVLDAICFRKCRQGWYAANAMVQADSIQVPVPVVGQPC